MNRKEDIKKSIITQGLLPLFYNDSSDVSASILWALYNAGIRIVEYTNRGENALDNFLFLRKLVSAEMSDLKLGTGTIKTKTDAEVFIAAGADFIVCPVVDPSIAEMVHKAQLLWIPGCMTATEINTAELNGASLVKIFPGNILGPTYITAIKEIFPGLLFMPTGGVEVNKENIQSWFDAGVSAVGMGSRLITRSIINNQDFDKLTADCIHALALVQQAKQKK